MSLLHGKARLRLRLETAKRIVIGESRFISHSISDQGRQFCLMSDLIIEAALGRGREEDLNILEKRRRIFDFFLNSHIG